MLTCDKSSVRSSREVRQVSAVAEELAKIPKKDNDNLDQWLQLTGHGTTISKTILKKLCKKIHHYCASKERILSFWGLRGPPGPQGAVGSPGKRGQQGKVGLTGLIGNIGEKGLPGENGRCNCSFPDLRLHQIPTATDQTVQDTLPQPSKISLKETVGESGMASEVNLSAIQFSSKFATVSRAVSIVPTKIFQSTLVPGIFGKHMKTDNKLSKLLPEMRPVSDSPSYNGNKRVCFLDAVGIPVLHAESQYSAVGSWMRDNKPYSHEMAERRWVTDDYASPVLYEYENERQLMNKKQKIKYYVDYLASGTGSIIFNGSYYYHRHSSSILVKYDLESTDQIQKSLGDISYLDCSRRRDHTFENCNETERDIWLYNRPHNYIDYGADENGLWVVYVRSGMKHITVSKIEPDMKIVRTWNIYELNATDIAETFIMCGVLYGLKSVTDRDTFINFAYDLYRNKTIDVNVKWYNPFGGLTMLHYNPTDKRLYFFDSKRLLSVNVRVEGETDQFEFEEDD